MRLKPTRVSFRRFGERICVALATTFWPRRATSLPYPGSRREPGTAEGFEQAPVGEAVARHHVERGAERRVGPHVEVIGAIALRRRRDVIAHLSGTVRAGIQRGNRAPDRVRQRRRNRIARCIGGHRADAREPFVGARAFVVGKEERPVTAYGAANRKSRLRPLIFRIGLSLGREVVRGVQRTVSDERIRSALKLVRARLRHDADLRGALAAMGSFGRAREHFEFLNRVDGRPNSRRVQLRIDVVCAVEQEAVEVFSSPIDAERKIAAHRARRSLGCRDSARAPAARARGNYGRRAACRGSDGCSTTVPSAGESRRTSVAAAVTSTRSVRAPTCSCASARSS